MRLEIRKRGLIIVGLLLAASLFGPAAARADQRTVAYEYDDLDRVTRVDYIGLADTTTINYIYDFGGNILSVTIGSVLLGDAAVVADARFLSVGMPTPNPFNARMAINFELRAAQRVTITIYDIRGSLVRNLLDSVIESGNTKVFWDGCDGRGASLASGVYFARVETDYRSENLRMLLVR